MDDSATDLPAVMRRGIGSRFTHSAANRAQRRTCNHGTRRRVAQCEESRACLTAHPSPALEPTCATANTTVERGGTSAAVGVARQF
jgi:hypothetical protein